MYILSHSSGIKGKRLIKWLPLFNGLTLKSLISHLTSCIRICFYCNKFMIQCKPKGPLYLHICNSFLYFLHPVIHKYKQIYIVTYSSTYINTYTHVWTQIFKSKYKHAFMHANKYTYIHTHSLIWMMLMWRKNKHSQYTPCL